MATVIDPDSLVEAARLAHELVNRLETAIGAVASMSDATAPRFSRENLPAAARVRGYLKARRARQELFPADLFADPAWDMLLDLFAATLEGKPVGVGSLCIASMVPTTTALRWIGRLEIYRLVERTDDPNDARRSYVRLTNRGHALVENWIDAHLPAIPVA